MIVRTDGAPAVMEVGFAEMVTVGVGLGAGVTAIMVLAVAFDLMPRAVTVYVVVADGLTDCVPPFDGSEKELPSLPVTVTDPAFVAVTVRVDELPAVMEVGLAEMLAVGAGAGPKCELLQAASPSSTSRPENFMHDFREAGCAIHLGNNVNPL